MELRLSGEKFVSYRDIPTTDGVACRVQIFHVVVEVTGVDKGPLEPVQWNGKTMVVSSRLSSSDLS